MHCAAVHGHHVVFFPLIHSGGMLDLEDEVYLYTVKPYL